MSLFASFARALTTCFPISPNMLAVQKTSVSPRSSPLGTFRAKERLRLSDRNSILMTQISVYIINPAVLGFQK